MRQDTHDEGFTIPSIENARPLTRADFARNTAIVPSTTGIYAAWIRDESARERAGIDGPVERPVYVGRAVGRSLHLRARLRAHVAGYFLDLIEIRASRGDTLFMWGNRYHAPYPGRMVVQTALTDMVRREHQAWQEHHLVWAWTPCSPEAAKASEAAEIRRHLPLLNRQLVEYLAPPQLRYRVSYEAAQTRWLWHASWAGAILAPFNFKRGSGGTRIWGRPTDQRPWSVADDGFPSPHDTGARQPPKEPSDRALRSLMKRAAASAEAEVRDAAARSSAEERKIWWATHAGAPYLMQPMTVEDALRVSLTRSPERLGPAPRTLPSPRRVSELVALTTTLSGAAD